MNNKYHIEIGNSSHLVREAYKSVVFYDELKLVFYKEGAVIYEASLLPDRRSLGKTLTRARNKIKLVSERLGINVSSFYWDNTDISLLEKLYFKLLFSIKLMAAAALPTQWIIVYKKENATEWNKILPTEKFLQADPFIAYENNKYYVFYEELAYQQGKGYIAVSELEVDGAQEGQLTHSKKVIEEDYHLSYPYLFQIDNGWYMIPESSENKTIDLYECISFPSKWVKKKTLIDNIEAVDSSVVFLDNIWYLFATVRTQGASLDDELSIFTSSDLLHSPFTRLYKDPVVTDVSNARMGGKLIQDASGLYRVSQDCSKRYGYKLNFNKIIKLKEGYKEEKIKTISPPKGALGFHTYNKAKGVEVGDIIINRFGLYSYYRFIGIPLIKAFKGLVLHQT